MTRRPYLRGIVKKQSLVSVKNIVSDRNKKLAQSDDKAPVFLLADLHEEIASLFLNALEETNDLFLYSPNDGGSKIIDFRPSQALMNKVVLSSQKRNVSVRIWIYSAIEYFIQNKGR